MKEKVISNFEEFSKDVVNMLIMKSFKKSVKEKMICKKINHNIDGSITVTWLEDVLNTGEKE
jgi:hypothetical protein